MWLSLRGMMWQRIHTKQARIPTTIALQTLSSQVTRFTLNHVLRLHLHLALLISAHETQIRRRSHATQTHTFGFIAPQFDSLLPGASSRVVLRTLRKQHCR